MIKTAYEKDNAPNLQMRSHLPAITLSKLRAWWHRARGVDISSDAVLFPGTKLLRYPKKIRIATGAVIKSGAHLCPCNVNAYIDIGARTSIGFHTFLYASAGIRVGDDCMIAPFVYIVDSDHGMKKGVTMNRQPNIARLIHIGSDVWIGAHSVILGGVTIGDGAIVAAGAVVRDNIPANMIVGGVPARILGERE
jgi:acetyltransferase-like isoleucine patch superfamily enzyme